MPAFICSGVALAIWSRAVVEDRYNTMNLVILSPLYLTGTVSSGLTPGNEKPAGMVQLNPCGNILLLTGLPKGHYVTDATGTSA
jgi:hypothetical protein